MQSVKIIMVVYRGTPKSGRAMVQIKCSIRDTALLKAMKPAIPSSSVHSIKKETTLTPTSV